MLDAPKGGGLCRENALIDGDHSIFQLLHNAPDTTKVATVEISGQPVDGVIGNGDGLGLILEADDGCNWTENLVLHNAHFPCDAREHRGRIEGALRASATRAHGAPCCGGLFHETGDTRCLARIDQWAEVDTLAQAIAHLQLANPCHQFLNKCVMHAILHEQAIGAHACLPGIAIFRQDYALYRSIQIRIFKDDEGRIAT